MWYVYFSCGLVCNSLTALSISLSEYRPETECKRYASEFGRYLEYRNVVEIFILLCHQDSTSAQLVLSSHILVNRHLHSCGSVLRFSMKFSSGMWNPRPATRLYNSWLTVNNANAVKIWWCHTINKSSNERLQFSSEESGIPVKIIYKSANDSVITRRKNDCSR